MITGPANFPVARAEKARNAEHNRNEECIAYFNKIVDYAEKEKYYAENPTARPIQSDDENAIEKLQAKLDICKANQEKMIQANKLIRKNDHEGLRALFGDDYAEKVLKHDYLSRVGFAQFELSNNRAEIKRLEGRINEIQKRKATTPKDLMINGVRFLENHEAMRIQIFFEGKPDAAMITLLKSCAFKWAPSVKAWQRQLTNNAIDAVNRRIIPAVKGV
jgi:hypothetical protein